MPSKDQRGKVSSGFGGPSLANATLVSQDDADDNNSSVSVALGSFEITIPKEQSSQTAQNTTTDGFSFIRQFYAKRGVPEESTNILCASWRISTQSQYQIYVKKWLHFCHRGKMDLLQFNEINCLKNFNGFI